MLKEEIISLKSGNWGRVCDTCHLAACTVYCRVDSAYLCTSCDSRIHAANSLSSRHERVRVCDACERAPAAFTCKADAASLCTTCDADIHSANPLASRHHRVPVMPILYGPQAADQEESMMSMGGGYTEGRFMSNEEAGDTLDDDDDEAASWLLLNPSEKVVGQKQNNRDSFFLGGDDEYLDLVEYSSCQDNQLSNDDYRYNNEQFSDDLYNRQQQQQYYTYTVPQEKSYGGGGGGETTDSIVPVQCGGEPTKNHQLQQKQNFQHHKFQTTGFDFEYETSNTGYDYPASLVHSISMSSMELGVVPESAMSDVSISHPRPPKGTIHLFSSPPIQMPTQLTSMDREARVLRYREKKKTRKFEKTIRYASRKAYAEKRPRIKGRFAKRTDADVEVDQMFSMTLMTEIGYGIVPSF